MSQVRKYRHAYERGGIVYVYGRIDGRTIRRSTGKEVSPASLKWADRNWLEIASATKPIPTTLNEFARRCLQAGERKPQTTREYVSIYERKIAPFFGSRKIADITPLELREWQSGLNKAGYAAGAVKAFRKVFSCVLNDALTEGIIARSPFTAVKAPKRIKTEIRPFNLDEIGLICETATGWVKNFLILSFFTGLRTGEAMALEWANVNFQTDTLSVKGAIRHGQVSRGKTENARREVDLLPAVKDALRRQWLETGAQGGLVFMFNGGLKHTWQIRGVILVLRSN